MFSCVLWINSIPLDFSLKVVGSQACFLEKGDILFSCIALCESLCRLGMKLDAKRTRYL
jgi:hypothetical protein